MSDYISRQAVLNTLDNMEKALDEERTVEKYKELLTECIKVLPSAEGEYIKKEDLLNSVIIQDSPYGDFEEKVVTIEDIEKLPTYSFPDKENDYMKAVRRDCGLYE